MLRLFTEHPATVGETWGEHWVFASRLGGRMVLAGLACMIHAWLPFLFKRTASTAIKELHPLIVDRGGPPPGPAA